MVGDIHVDDGVEFEVVWGGGEGLVHDRPTRVSDTWTAPHRIYNKSGKHSAKGKSKDNMTATIDKSEEIIDCECVRIEDPGDGILDDMDKLNKPDLDD